MNDTAELSIKDQLISRPAFCLRGSIVAPGDKSISHRAMILGALAQGTTKIEGLLEAEDVFCTLQAMRQLGAKIEQSSLGKWNVTGVGSKGLTTPTEPLDFGNAGTGVRLCLGLVAGQNIRAEFTGDDSLCKRPMNRVLQPLAKMGANTNSNNGCLPVVVQGTEQPIASCYKLDVASAQIKSALLLAGLGADGLTTVEEPGPSRDHTETMLQQFGAKITTRKLDATARQVTLHGPVVLQATPVSVPGDPSSAAFAAIAALIVPGSDINICNVMTNPTRFGLFTTLQQAGYDVRFSHQTGTGEPVADIRVRFGCTSPLRPPAALAVTMIDEYPALMVLAAFANGTSRFAGIGELRVKESDRIAKMAELLQQNGVCVRTGDTWMEVDGAGAVFGPTYAQRNQKAFAADGDHRIAMCALVMAMGSFLPIRISGGKTIGTSYPKFIDNMNKLGAEIKNQPQNPALVIAVDGPSASGKGTLAKRLAQRLKLPYLDTGLLYRATALAALQAETDLEDAQQLAGLASSLTLPIAQENELRTAQIGATASKVAAVPEVRAALVEVQRRFAGQAGGAVLDGRDIGTVICPDADIKFWVTASEQVRAMRRQNEMTEAGQHIELDEMLQQLRERDARDAGRKNAPMKKPADAHLIDTSNLAIDAALAVALQRVERMLIDRA
ncbi:3-phosphoshikimate 1-carboxyvinyltransferase [hydrothermal vent metagenome]|uniref:3-phosphoshikimate 1-carboxyvinyltransferase n=1 Tax=hydrothermal vent metagenome TaxID=652676 RepID=A0A3B0RXE6_9ZZZZ